MSDGPLRRLGGVAVVANLVGQVLIIVTGGSVRLTGSGLGCSTWPQCEPGSMTPVFSGATSLHPYVEFGNRLVGVALGLVALAMAVLVWVAVARAGRSVVLRRLAVGVLGGVLLQAVIGGISVRADLHPAIVGSHFLISAALVAVSTGLVVRWFEPDGPARPTASPVVRRLGTGLAVLTTVVVVLGVVVTGAGPHSGDADVGYRFAVDPVAVSRLHALAVWGFLAVLVTTTVAVHRARPAVPAQQVWTRVTVVVTLAQGAIGYVQYFTGLPELLVGLHMLGSALLVASVTRLLTTMRTRGTTGSDEGVEHDRDVVGV